MNSPDREMISLADRRDARGGEMALCRFGQAGKPPLVFAHATGMCASAYRQFLAPLSSEFDVMAPDFRGHGRSDLPTDGIKLRNWSVYTHDLEALLLSLPAPAAGWRLMGHSMGAVTSLMVAARARIHVSHLVLVEPVIVPGWASIWARTPAYHLMKRYIPIARRAAQRRDRWPSHEIAERAYGRKGFFSSWAEGVLQDYLEDGLTETDTGVRLSCAPAWESATFAAQGQNFWRHLSRVQQTTGLKLHIFLAERESTALGPARAALAKKGVDVTVIDGAGHLLPQEQPGKLAELAGSML